MKRLVIAASLVAAIGPPADAQPPLLPQPRPEPPPATVLPPLPPPSDVQLPQPVQPPGPAIPVFKSGGLVSGTDGYYPYDTGPYLLGLDRGLYRYGGYYAMHFPPPLVMKELETVHVSPVTRPALFPHCRLFRR